MTNSLPNQLTKAQQYLRSAEMLVSFGDFDSAASRLYYAMLYAAEAALAAKGVTLKRQRDVLWGFGQHLVKTGEVATELHRWLLEGFDAQQRADRSYQSSLTEDDIRELRLNAAEFVERIELWLRTKETS